MHKLSNVWLREPRERTFSASEVELDLEGCAGSALCHPQVEWHHSHSENIDITPSIFTSLSLWEYLHNSHSENIDIAHFNNTEITLILRLFTSLSLWEYWHHFHREYWHHSHSENIDITLTRRTFTSLTLRIVTSLFLCEILTSASLWEYWHHSHSENQFHFFFFRRFSIASLHWSWCASSALAPISASTTRELCRRTSRWRWTWPPRSSPTSTPGTPGPTSSSLWSAASSWTEFWASVLAPWSSPSSSALGREYLPLAGSWTASGWWS